MSKQNKLFFWTDGKSFAEFLLEDEKKERAKSPLKQNKNPQESNSLQQRKKNKETVGVNNQTNKSTNQGRRGQQLRKS